MDRSAVARLGIAGAVAGIGLTAGGVAIASAETSSTPDSAASSYAHPGGHRGDHGLKAEVLAKELGLGQDRVQQALDAVREELRPDGSDSSDGTKPAPPTDAMRAARQAALAEALADELGVSEAKVKAALEVVQEQADAQREARRAEFRTNLVTRLDAAVKAGALTQADKTSVLKAFDARLLGGSPEGRGGPGGANDAAGSTSGNSAS